MRRWLLAAPAAALVLAAGCDGRAPEPGEGQAERSETEAAVAEEPVERRVYERFFTFVSGEGAGGGEDAMPLIIPWLFTAATGADGVRRSARGWIGRSGAWDAFQEERWTTPRSRAPWRILPRGSMRIVVGTGDGVETLIFREGDRWLELSPGPPVAEWGDPRGSTYSVSRGEARVAGTSVPGTVLDIARARRRDAARPGDWAFLVGGDTLQLVLSAPREGPVRDSLYAAWLRSGPRERRWDSVVVRWEESRAYEAARRNVPVRWRIRAREPSLALDLDVLSSRLAAAGGGGPVLAVEALFAVGGVIRSGSDSARVTGLFRHRQP